MFTAAGEWLAAARSPFVLWMHAAGMEGAWDAPWEMRRQWSDDDDPDPPAFVEPPVRRLVGEIDPDELLGIMHAYAAQVAVLDACLDVFLGEFVESLHARETLVVFTSPRGYPLGEHRRIGPVDDALYGELLRTPLLLRFPDGRGAGHRPQAIVQPPDLYATLVAWLGLPTTRGAWGRSLLPVAAAEEWPRDRALVVHGPERALRTPAWFLRSGPASDAAPAAIDLFVKPDDQWEVNEVSDRLPQVVEEMTATMENLEQAIRANDETSLAPLSDVLREGRA
jgi:hypothetical protein